MRRIREANMVTAEHYRYVLHDLRLTGILAALMFTVIIVLHFVLSKAITASDPETAHGGALIHMRL
jgi:hypothetical protein